MTARTSTADGPPAWSGADTAFAQCRLNTVRTLPLRVQPATGESIESWLEALASRSNATWGEILSAVGLHGESNRVRVPRFTVSLAPAQLSEMSYATGVATSVITSMTSSSLFRSATADAMSAGDFASARSRFCPKCLADSGGRWQLWWKLRWAFACPIHQCLLVDLCPRCLGDQRRRPLPQSLVPRPGFCTCRARDSWGRSLQRCDALLSTTQTMDLADAHPALTAQDYLLAVVARGSISTGIYTQSRVSSLQFATDLTVLAQQIVWHARTQAMQSRVPEDVWNRNENMGIQHDSSDRAATTLWLAHDSAATVALAACIVMPILQASTAEAAGQHLRTLLLPARRAGFSSSATAVGWGREVSAPLAGVQSSILATLLGPIDQLRNQIWAPHPHRRDHHMEIHQSVPAWLWPQWTHQFDAPGVGLDELRMAVSVALLLVGSRLSVRSACAKLGSVISAHAVMRVLGVLSSQSAWTTTVSVLVSLARLLASGVCPIDYQRRRQLFVTDLLTDRQWERICHELGTPAEDLTRAYLCRWWLYERITGSPTRRGPATYEGRRFWRMYSELPATLTTEEVAALDACARRFLDAHGMAAEPLSWQPPLGALAPIG